jgi:hypothetical protein
VSALAKLLQVREHANGRRAEVYLQADGRLYAREWPLEQEESRRIWFSDDLPTLQIARALADVNAHRGCNGKGCGKWQNHSDLEFDPRRPGSDPV